MEISQKSLQTLLIVFMFMISVASIAQSDAEISKLCEDMCKQMNSDESGNPEQKIQTVYEVNLMPFIIQHEITVVDDLIDKIHFTLYKTCPYYREFIISQAPDAEKKGDWEMVDTIPESSVTAKQAKALTKAKRVYYLEATGKKTYVEIKKGKWTDKFQDGTTSELKFKWIDHNTFELEFIESNNRSRKGLSFKGDKYLYRLIELKDDYFIFVTLPTSKVNYAVSSKFYLEN
jgi:hypothetical protein